MHSNNKKLRNRLRLENICRMKIISLILIINPIHIEGKDTYPQAYSKLMILTEVAFRATALFFSDM